MFLVQSVVLILNPMSTFTMRHLVSLLLLSLETGVLGSPIYDGALEEREALAGMAMLLLQLSMN